MSSTEKNSQTAPARTHSTPLPPAMSGRSIHITWLVFLPLRQHPVTAGRGTALRASAHCSLATGHWSLITAYCSLVTGHCFLKARPFIDSGGTNGLSLAMHRPIVRNSLLSPASIKRLIAIPVEDAAYAALGDTFAPFHQIKDSASEVQTETQLVRPLLKVLGYSVEPKPKFFEDQIKGPDFALFCSEEERIANSKRWGTKEFYRNTAALLSAKRYGRNLTEGISGFYLDFESRIPVYQMFYHLVRAETPWGILTNGKNWILFRRPRAFEKRLIELDLGGANITTDKEALHLLYQLFSCGALANSLPSLLEEERTSTISFLKEKKAAIVKTLEDLHKKVEVYPKLLPFCGEIFPGWKFPLTR